MTKNALMIRDASDRLLRAGNEYAKFNEKPSYIQSQLTKEYVRSIRKFVRLVTKESIARLQQFGR
jgi:hypothetical protein